MYSEYKEGTIGMLKMNIKPPTPTQYGGKTPQFNEWAGKVKSYLTVHNIYIEELMDDSTRSQVPMVVATTQRGLHGQMGSNREEEEEGRHCSLQPDIELCVAPCYKARIRATFHYEE
eukprot:3253926-Amphidinium_carterae.1